MSAESLYMERNELLHRATSYRGKTKTATMRERSRCFLEAEKLTRQLEEWWASQSRYTAPNYNLYNAEGQATHFLLTSDGITHRYVPIAQWNAAKQAIRELSPLERLRYYENSHTSEEIEFQEAVEELYQRLAP